MAEPVPQANGHVNGQPERYIDSIKLDDPEREKELMKSVEVREDVRAMEARKRVSEILNSEAFRDELEEIIETQPDLSSESNLKSGPHPASLIALQQISQLILPRASNATIGLAGAVGGPVVPIADIRGINSSVYSKGERVLRCKLASLYRLMDLHGWTSGIYNHITVRISQDKEHFLINPFGLMYNEVTAGSLIKIDMQGNIIDRGNTSLGVNKAGFMLHSAIHAARPDVRCIVHTHVPATVTVSAMKQGLLPLSQEAMLLGEISYHDYEGILVDEEERERIGRSLGPNNKVLFLRNHGLVTCGATIEEAWALMENTVAACETQIRMAPLGLDNLILPSEAAIQRARDNAQSMHVNMGSESAKKWRAGELEFEAWMRIMDNAGYRTGYLYRQPLLKNERTDRQTSGVEYPPATSTLAYYDEADGVSPAIREAQERNKRLQKTDWLNTPNVYRREEFDEIGTENPKKITKWVQNKSPDTTNPAIKITNKNQFAPIGGERREMKNKYKEWVPDTDSPKRQAATGTPIKISNPNQFAPQGANPKEFIQHQRQIKDGYYQDKITAGPQSKILEGDVTDGQVMDAAQSATGDHIRVVGAASKGIIKREHQHNAVVYKSYVSSNPFDKMTVDELREYEEAVKRGEKPSKEDVLAAVQQEPDEAGETTEVSPTEPLVTDVTTPEGEQTRLADNLRARDFSSPYSKSQQSPNKSSAHQAHLPSEQYSNRYDKSKSQALRRTKSRETNIDDALNENSSNTLPGKEPPRSEFKRRNEQYSSMKAPSKSSELVDEIKDSKDFFQRSKSERKPKKGNKGAPASPNSTQNGDQEEGHAEENGQDSPSKEGKKKKDKKSRMPSFSFGKKKDKDSKKTKQQSNV